MGMPDESMGMGISTPGSYVATLRSCDLGVGSPSCSRSRTSRDGSQRQGVSSFHWAKVGHTLKIWRVLFES